METLSNLLPWIQIGLSVLMVALILIQQSDSGLGAAFGGGDASGATFNKKRGFEKTIFILTIAVAIIWTATAVLNLFV